MTPQPERRGRPLARHMQLQNPDRAYMHRAPVQVHTQIEQGT